MPFNLHELFGTDSSTDASVTQATTNSIFSLVRAIHNNQDIEFGKASEQIALYTNGSLTVSSSSNAVLVLSKLGATSGLAQIYNDGNLHIESPDATKSIWVGASNAAPLIVGFGGGAATFYNQIISVVATGTAPLSIASTTAVANLNADLVDGSHASAFAPVAHDMVTSHTTTGGANLDVFGLSAANTIARLTPSNNPGAAAILASDSAGDLTLQHLKLATGSNQLVFNSAGAVKGTLTWSPATADKLITLPNLTGTLALGAGSGSVSSTNDVTVASHTHAITTNSNPGAAAAILASNASGGLALDTSTFTVDATNHRVGIGTTSPSYTLQVVNTGGGVNFNTDYIRSGSGTRALFQAYDVGASAYRQQQFDAASYLWQISGASKMAMDTSGNVGIGTTNPGAQLDLSTDSARKLTTTTWSTGSDARIKTEIRGITDGLDMIRQLRPVKYRYNREFLAAHPSVRDVDHYNFIAQEYRQVFPDSVTETDGLLYLNNSNMIPYAIAGIQELDARIRRLEELN